jgi:hypothetical protein
MGVLTRMAEKNPKWNYIRLAMDIIFILVIIYLFMQTKEICLGQINQKLKTDCGECMTSCAKFVDNISNNFTGNITIKISEPTS